MGIGHTSWSQSPRQSSLDAHLTAPIRAISRADIPLVLGSYSGRRTQINTSHDTPSHDLTQSLVT